MVELVELLSADGLLVGAALQPVTNTTAPSTIKIKVVFIWCLPCPTYLTDMLARQTQRTVAAKFIYSGLEMR